MATCLPEDKIKWTKTNGNKINLHKTLGGRACLKYFQTGCFRMIGFKCHMSKHSLLLFNFHNSEHTKIWLGKGIDLPTSLAYNTIEK